MTPPREHPVDSFPSPENAEAENANPVVRFYEGKLGEFFLWTGTLGGPILWLIQFQTNYTLVRWVCATGHRNVLNAVTIAFFLLSAGTGLLSWWNWTRIGRHLPSSATGGVRGRSRLLAVLGLLTSALFTLLILSQGIANFMFDPCEY